MSEVTYRKAQARDLPEAVMVYVTARNQMLSRHNLTVPPDDTEAAQLGLQHILRTGHFEVAEQEERLVGVSYAIVRDGIWFLSGFWVRPAAQRQGIGGPLLRRVQRAGVAAGARTFCVWSSIDATAMATYMKLGMLPGTQILNLAVDGARVTLPPVSGGYETRPLEPKQAAAIDQVVRGTPRLVDHRWWASLADRTGRLVLRGGRPCGYYYALHSGDVLPAAWLDHADAEVVLGLACREGLDRAGRTSLRLPGYNHAGIRFALGAGMQLRGFSHFLTSGPFGRLGQYAASGPLLF